MNVVEDDWLPVTGRLGQTDIARNDGFKHLGSKEAAEIRSYLAGQGRALVVHCKEDALDCEVRIQSPADAHQGVEKLGDPLKGEVFALNWDEN